MSTPPRYNKGMSDAQIAQVTEFVPLVAREAVREEIWHDVTTHPAQNGSYFVSKYTERYGVSRRTVYGWLKSVRQIKRHTCYTQDEANTALSNYVNTLHLAQERLWDIVDDKTTSGGTRVQALRSIVASEQKLFTIIDNEGSNPLSVRARQVYG